MRNKTIVVIVDKDTGVVKSIETEIIIPKTQSMEEMIWECKTAMRKTINKKKYKILNINVYLYE